MKITYHFPSDPNFENAYSDIYNSIIEISEIKGFLSSNLSEIIICDNIVDQANRLKYPDSVYPAITQEREFKAFGRIFFKDDAYIMILDGTIINPNSATCAQMIWELMLDIYVGQTILKEEPKINLIKDSDTLKDRLNADLYCWYKVYKSKIIYDDLKLPRTDEFVGDFSIYITKFKRKVKKLHYIYQNDNEKLGLLYLLFLREYFQLIEHCLTYFRYYKDYSFLKDEDLSPSIKLILDEVLKLFETIDKNKKISLTKLCDLSNGLFKLCYVELTDTPNGTNIRILHDPKKLFKGSLVDTEDRIVAFIDILGFKDIIQEYDTDEFSNILKDLQNALNDAVNISITQILPNNQNIREHLEYSMFSDCISISLPYYDNDTDFIYQFHCLGLITKTYYHMMASKGFFLRGGISIGSFYSDNNMIFSGGLVKAYKLEGLAKYPRIVVDYDIIRRLISSDKEYQESYLIRESIVFDLVDGVYFLNIFDLIKNIPHYTNQITESLNGAISEVEGLSNDPLNKAFGSLISSFTKLFVNPVWGNLKDTFSTGDISETITQLMLLVIQQEEKYNNNLPVQEKYTWLRQYLEDIYIGLPSERFHFLELGTNYE
ncbi:hypothetical protein [Daejeonella sp.]|uniref:hypothetical protein n=1 Tax=Daejeonella sp. TaxID=2805397 RepID=UPI0027317279|nr:hypothetical protein [Daejeonella sp.]MDP2413847.1 hypothetical protein [Daejeonella sp.]